MGRRLFGGGLDGAHVADAGEGEVERARDGRRGHGEDVDLGAHLLEALLVGDAEALLLVHDDEAEVLERDVFLDEAGGYL